MYHYAIVAKVLGRKPDEWQAIEESIPEFPETLGYLWDWFVALSRSRQSGMAANPISEQEILAFCINRNLRLSAFELDALRYLDSIALTDFTKDT